jgi:hypothetical protein
MTICKCPSLQGIITRAKRAAEDNKIASVLFGFIMDNVTALRNYSTKEGYDLTVYPDPVFTPFDGIKRFLAEKNEDLLIHVRHFSVLMSGFVLFSWWLPRVTTLI